MTANLVSGFSPIQDLIPTNAASAKGTADADFSNVLKNSTDAENSQTPDTKADKPVAKDEVDKTNTETDKTDKVEAKDEPQKSTKADDKAGTTDETKDSTEGLDEEQIEAVAQAVATMVQTIAEVLDVPTEVVTEAIETLGIEPEQILDSKVIPQIAIEVTGADDMMQIMTDENLYADVKELMADADTILAQTADELNIPVDELMEKIEDEVLMPKTDVNEEGRQTTDFDATDLISDEIEFAEVETVKEAPKTSKQNAGNSRHESAQSPFSQTITETLKEAVNARVEETTFSYTTVSTEQIMEQVTENLKLSMNEDMTQMEMQLHPASLGNVKVQVAAKDGVITASFTTQNEQVKAALEAQVVQLKEQMNEQGIKVAAIEVTVSAHAFERNLNEQGGRDNGSNSQAKAKKVRGINLNELSDEELDEIDEEDKVVADMMARQGNTVDYMA